VGSPKGLNKAMAKTATRCVAKKGSFPIINRALRAHLHGVERGTGRAKKAQTACEHWGRQPLEKTEKGGGKMLSRRRVCQTKSHPLFLGCEARFFRGSHTTLCCE